MKNSKNTKELSYKSGSSFYIIIKRKEKLICTEKNINVEIVEK